MQVHKTKVYNTCLGFVHKQHDAEDLAQEVFLEAFRKWGQFKGASSVKTWLYKIAVNKSLEFLRYKNRNKRKGISVDYKDFHQIDYEHPGIQLEKKERANILMSHIRMLPEQQQTAFVLHKLEGLGYDEIGRVMDKSKSSVESLLHRAKLQLQKTLNSYYVSTIKT